MESLAQQLTFIRELDRLKAVQRRALVQCDDNRYENAAEHSWHLAVMAHVLVEHAEPGIAVDRVVRMLLIHDIVEIDAGDTFAFGPAADISVQLEKETRALERICGLLPVHQGAEMKDLWREFEEGVTADARYAKALDRLLPLLQNVVNNGGSWSRHTVARSQVLERNKYLAASAPRLWAYACEQIEYAVSQGWLVDDRLLLDAAREQP